ncbi:MAG: glycosyltransferase [Bacteriovorax sp.]|nr:glycosyltransferase [Bacteriovorax sp.]
MIKKNVWILNHKTEDIQSVNRISQNLSKLYLSLPEESFEVLEIDLMDLESEKSVDSDFKNRIVQFKDNTPDHVIIIHPGITNHLFLSALLSIKTEVQTQFVFHIFGNFIRYGENWFSLNHLLTKKNIQFVVASKCYFEVLANFISKENIYVLPFPINSKDDGEKHLNIKVPGEVLNVMYAGRYHEQKNVTCLISSLNDISKNTEKKICLTLVVYFDDFNPTTINSKKILGEQFHEYVKEINKLSGFFEVKILPHQNEAELNFLYQSNDAVISFSTFLDEDYGNTIIESLAEGTPCIVSNWGGYKDFCQEFPDDCFGMDVVLEKEKLYLETEKLAIFLEQVAKRTPEDRAKLIQKTKKHIGQDKLFCALSDLFYKKNIFSHFDKVLLTFALELKSESGKKPLENFKKYYKSFW